MERSKNQMGARMMSLAFGQAVLLMLGSIFGVWANLLSNQTKEGMTAASMLLFWILADIAEPVAAHRFTGISARKMAAWVKLLTCDLVCIAGIFLFLHYIGGIQGRAITGAAIFAAGACLGRRSREEFYGRHSEDRNGAK